MATPNARAIEVDRGAARQASYRDDDRRRGGCRHRSSTTTASCTRSRPGGGVIRTAARQVRKAGRQTKGVRLMNLGEDNTLLAIARNAEENADEDGRGRRHQEPAYRPKPVRAHGNRRLS